MPVRRRTAASARIAPSAAGTSSSEVRRRLIDEAAQVAGPAADEHRVDPGAGQLGDLVPTRARQLGDRELSGRNVRQQVEHPLQVELAVVRLFGGQEQELGVEALEHALELLLVAD